jgi:hypothetical protein
MQVRPMIAMYSYSMRWFHQKKTEGCPQRDGLASPVPTSIGFDVRRDARPVPVVVPIVPFR